MYQIYVLIVLILTESYYNRIWQNAVFTIRPRSLQFASGALDAPFALNNFRHPCVAYYGRIMDRLGSRSSQPVPFFTGGPIFWRSRAETRTGPVQRSLAHITTPNVMICLPSYQHLFGYQH